MRRCCNLRAAVIISILFLLSQCECWAWGQPDTSKSLVAYRRQDEFSQRKKKKREASITAFQCNSSIVRVLASVREWLRWLGALCGGLSACPRVTVLGGCQRIWRKIESTWVLGIYSNISKDLKAATHLSRGCIESVPEQRPPRQLADPRYHWRMQKYYDEDLASCFKRNLEKSQTLVCSTNSVRTAE